ncbi:flagellar basal body L-ring protein FlgH [Paracoccaceae bacterium GXU_MW_L88]
MKIFISLLGLLMLTACGAARDIGREPELSPVPLPPMISPVQQPVQAAAYNGAAQDTTYGGPMIESQMPPSGPSLWQAGPNSLLGDRRANALGDILTVVIDIEDEARIQNSSEFSRSGNEQMTVGALLGLDQKVGELIGGENPLSPGVSFDSRSAAQGDGSVQRGEEITLRVAATVTQVLTNGHFYITGSQQVRVNFEMRDLQIAGIVRPEDISRRNEITYDKIAGARISYGGRGRISNAQQPRYGQQIVDSVLPF